MNCPPSANMFMIRAPFPRAIGTDFLRRPGSVGSTEGRVHPLVRMYWPKEISPSIINGSWKPLAVVKVN
jgi:hypothetical protein